MKCWILGTPVCFASAVCCLSSSLCYSSVLCSSGRQPMVSTKWSKDIEVAQVPVNRNHVKSASSCALLAFSTIEVKQLPDRNLDVGWGSCNISLYHNYTDLYSSTDTDPEWVMSEEVNRCAKKACCPWLGMDYNWALEEERSAKFAPQKWLSGSHLAASLSALNVPGHDSFLLRFRCVQFIEASWEEGSGDAHQGGINQYSTMRIWTNLGPSDLMNSINAMSSCLSHCETRIRVHCEFIPVLAHYCFFFNNLLWCQVGYENFFGNNLQLWIRVGYQITN